MKYILGKKLGMTQHISETGELTPVTVIEAGPCVVTQVKGKRSFQIGFDTAKNISKPLAGHLKDHKCRYLREFNLDETNEAIYQLNQSVDVSIITKENTVDVTGISKGKGFQGTVKRHNFKIGPKTHGSKNHRKPGSIGCRFPQKVIKGRRLPGRMGDEQITVRKISVVDIEPDKNLLLIKGSVPGQNGRLLVIRQQ